MIFSSNPFIFVFLPIVLCGYYLLARIARPFAAAWLVAASLVFYGYWNPTYLFLLIASICWNYGTGELIFRLPEEKARLRFAILWGGIAGNLGLLAYYKYLGPTLSFLSAHHVLPPQFETHILLPLGISFFTFTQIGYLVDSYDGKARERGPLSYLLFVTFFPHLIAGPILHNREMMPQFADRETYRFHAENLAVGLAIFIFGIAKKVLLADPLGFIADAGFAQHSSLGMAGAWMTVLSYSLQLYFDFAGYSDMAIGIARMFGIVFPANFNSPYKARSIIDFWSRWHMTLTRYLTLYLYNPVAMQVTRTRARRGLPMGRKATRTPSAFAAMVVWPTVLTMGLAGIWHGAGLQFLIFGLLHAAYLSMNHAWRIFGPQKAVANRWNVLAYLPLTYAAVLIAQIFFRAESTGDAVVVLSRLVAGDEGLNPGSMVTTARIVLGFGICLLLPNTQQIMRHYRPILESVAAPTIERIVWRPTLTWGTTLGAVLLAALLRMSDVSKFLYFQF